MASHLRIAVGLAVALAPVLAVLIAPAGAVSTCTHVEVEIDDTTSTMVEHDSNGTTCPEIPSAGLLSPCPSADIGARTRNADGPLDWDVYACVDGIF